MIKPKVISVLCRVLVKMLTSKFPSTSTSSSHSSEQKLKRNILSENPLVWSLRDMGKSSFLKVRMMKKDLSSGEMLFLLFSIREDFMNFSNLSRRLEREISPQCIWSTSMKMVENMQPRPFRRKLPTVRRMERNRWSSKLNSWGNSIIEISWRCLKSMKVKTQSTSSWSS